MGWVGENGPELMHLPAGATITPNNQTSPVHSLLESWMNGESKQRPMRIQVMINRKVLADVVAEEVASQTARS
jgi:phage-related tail protein